MYIYILNGRFIESETKLDLKPSQMCTTKLVKNKYYMLDKERVAFKTNHPEAKVVDVLRLGFRPAPYAVNAPKRQDAYRNESDPMYIAYQKYLALEQFEEAEAMKKQWLRTIRLIDERYPYSDHSTIKVIPTESLASEA